MWHVSKAAKLVPILLAQVEELKLVIEAYVEHGLVLPQSRKLVRRGGGGSLLVVFLFSLMVYLAFFSSSFSLS